MIRLACRLNTLEQTITKSLSISLLRTPFICVFLVGLHRINCCCQSAQFFCNWHSSAVYKDFLPVTCCQKPVRYHGLMPKQVSFHSNMRVVLVLLLIVSVIDLQKKKQASTCPYMCSVLIRVILFICKTGTSHKVYDLL